MAVTVKVLRTRLRVKATQWKRPNMPAQDHQQPRFKFAAPAETTTTIPHGHQGLDQTANTGQEHPGPQQPEKADPFVVADRVYDLMVQEIRNAKRRGQ